MTLDSTQKEMMMLGMQYSKGKANPRIMQDLVVMIYDLRRYNIPDESGFVWC